MRHIKRIAPSIKRRLYAYGRMSLAVRQYQPELQLNGSLFIAPFQFILVCEKYYPCSNMDHLPPNQEFTAKKLQIRVRVQVQEWSTVTAGANWHTASWSARGAKSISTSNFPNQLGGCCQCKPLLSWGKGYQSARESKKSQS